MLFSAAIFAAKASLLNKWRRNHDVSRRAKCLSCLPSEQKRCDQARVTATTAKCRQCKRELAEHCYKPGEMMQAVRKQQLYLLQCLACQERASSEDFWCSNCRRKKPAADFAAKMHHRHERICLQCVEELQVTCESCERVRPDRKSVV